MNSATDKYARLAPSAIIVPADRQRTEVELDETFLRSLRERGVLLPLLVTAKNELVAGGRRLAGSLKCELPDVPVRYVAEGLSASELRLIELEENVHRAELPWRDRVRATAELHALWVASRPGWTHAQSNEELGVQITLYLRVAKELDNPKLANCTNVRAAYNICTRLDERAADSILEDISHANSELLAGLDPAGSTLDEFVQDELPEGDERSPASVTSGQGEGDSAHPASQPVPKSPSAGHIARSALRVAMPAENVICADFCEWAKTYSGPRFNFLHCDFPYGKRVFAGEWGGKHAEEEFKYDDDPQVYWQLCAALCENMERLLTPTAHMMFWLSSEIANQSETIEFFRQHAPGMIFQPRALVWLKSDNVGITPDPVRSPRWITEICLMATRGDRPLVRPLANGYAAPTDRKLHPSAKPEPVLRHFFGMMVDSTTRLLDPTCGAGSALRAAESLGAESVLGLDRSGEYVQTAQRALKEFRNLRELTR